MSTKCKYSELPGGQIFYESTRGVKEVWPSNPGSFLFEDFLGIATTNQASRTDFKLALNSGTATTEQVAGSHGCLKMTTHTDDHDTASIAGPVLGWLPSQDPVIEVRAAVEDITNTGIFIGFSDAINEANQECPIYRAHGDAAWTTTATDAVGLVFDPHQATPVVTAHAVKNNTDATPISSGVALVNTTFATFRVHLVDDGSKVKAVFYLDGTYIGEIADCITRTVAITPFVAVLTRAAAGHYALIDYIKVWAKHS